MTVKMDNERKIEPVGKKDKNFSVFNFVQKSIVYIFLIFITIIVLAPVIWIIGASLNPGTSLFSSSLFPKEPTFKHYVELFTETDYPKWYLNTLKIATANMCLSVVLTTLTAYVFSRFRFKGRKLTLMTILILQMFPAFISMTATFVLLYRLHLLNTHLGLILVYAAGQIPYNTWLCKGYFEGIPKSLDEAARIDGASNLTIFTKIILPLAKPIITFVALTNFMGPWFDFIFPQLILKSSEKRTLAVGLFQWVQQQQNTYFTRFAAGAILVAIPITALFLYLQKHIVHGLSSGATKG
ncbi:sugar ABC transporter permease [Caldisalinibacter kiritimatiensis]|uniref:Maltose/maltodextrin ABC transporter, permease protein MalG n=1 Tax=Caldisalinibacter kiritimatiensis TaxID=1304284 RepID=R1CEQ0_9FIRM|nr:sugar ABC transporter permease [Caldisalinibacter kiritimatiensis]EOD00785.1 Maltose/maltodextrin ABC transporter, permease protein MalG [Caldisalinibacter kiritimatiensis]